MITYSRLGKEGQLGNQMFQYATLFSIGLTRGYKIGIPSTDQRISKVFEAPSAQLCDSILVEKLFKERDFTFDPNVFMVPDGTDLFGYFQSANYFDHCREALLREFKFKAPAVEKAASFHSTVNDRVLCSVHVRRKDYLKLSHYHNNLDGSYYEKACKVVTDSIKQPVRFLVFSDDTEWCRTTFTGDDVTIVDIGDDAAEMCLMSMCQVHIISNSSYSWWGAWLSGGLHGNAPVVAPKQWFGPQGPKNWETVYRKGWAIV
jgi:hypothetical protein